MYVIFNQPSAAAQALYVRAVLAGTLIEIVSAKQHSNSLRRAPPTTGPVSSSSFRIGGSVPVKINSLRKQQKW